MKRKISSLHPLRRIRPRLASLIGLMLAVAQVYPSCGADLRKTEDGAETQANSKCEKAPTAIDRLICSEPSLAALEAAIGPALQDYLDRAARPADRDARTADQRLWHDGRAMACPAAAQPQPDATPESAGNEGAVACLSRIYEHRVAVLRYEQPCKIRSVSI